MGIAALTSFTSDFFYNNDGTLTAEARAVVYGVIATVGTAAAGVAGSVLTNLWSKCTTQGNGTASIAAGSQNDNATGCISRLFKSCTERSVNMISCAAKRSWKMIKSQGPCRVVRITSLVALTMLGGYYAFDLSITSKLTGSAILLGAALALTRDGGSKKPKTKHKVKKYQEAVRVQNHLIQAPELKVQETFHTPTGPSGEDEDDKVFEVPAIDHDVERISAIESEIMERYEKMKFRLGE